ncbi:aromatic ring-hydroxylating dioxygenase subunit alpha [Pseudomonas mohnii]
MGQQKMYIKNCWYTVAWNYELEDEGLFKTSVLNDPMVIYRTADGGYAALEDRCCHRGAPLSKARREGDDLRCMYHGLKFNPSGRCVEIPGQPKIPENTCVRSYPVVEKHSWIWVWMGDPAKADVALIPRAMALDTPGFKSRSGFIEYDTDYQEVNDNLLDFSHLAYVHPTSFGASEDWAYTRPKIERLDRGLRVSRYVRNQDPAFGDKGTGKLDLWSSYDYQVPGVMLLHSHALLAGSADINNDGPPDLSKTPSLFTQYSCQAVTPLADGRSRYSFSILMPDIFDDDWVDEFWKGARQAFDEDREIIEAQYKVKLRTPDRPMIATSFDAGLGQFRWMIDKLIREENAEVAAAARGDVPLVNLPT